MKRRFMVMLAVMFTCVAFAACGSTGTDNTTTTTKATPTEVTTTTTTTVKVADESVAETKTEVTKTTTTTAEKAEPETETTADVAPADEEMYSVEEAIKIRIEKEGKEVETFGYDENAPEPVITLITKDMFIYTVDTDKELLNKHVNNEKINPNYLEIEAKSEIEYRITYNPQ